MTTKNPAHHGHFASGDGLRLYAEHDPVEGARARLLFVHGFAEHCGRYRDMCAQLAEAGYATHRYDMRGHGKADGPRGHIYAFSEYLLDFDAFCAEVNSRFPFDGPTFIVSHSNGGLITMHALLAGAGPFAGAVFSSPFFGFALKIPGWKSFLGRMLSKYVPAFGLPTDIPAEHVSHDPATIRGYATDPLVGKVATARWLTETMDAHAEMLARVPEVELPVLFQQAGSDKIADPKAARNGFDRLSSTDKTWKEYPALYHEVYFETDRQMVYDDLIEWLNARIEG